MEEKKQTPPHPPVPDTGVLTVVLPTPKWSRELVESFEDACRKLTGNIDVRKSLNKDEDAFIQAYINHCLSKVDKYIKQFLVEESKRIEALMKELRDLISLQLRVYKKEKAAFEEKLILGSGNVTFDFYVYESDLGNLKEMLMLRNLAKSSSSIKDISTREIQEFIIRISKRAQLELETGMKDYLSQCKVPITLKMKKLEPLGELREYRRNFFLAPRASEGDWEMKGRTKEAYNEDVAKSYSFKQLRYDDGGEQWYNLHARWLPSCCEIPASVLRQSTVKMSVELHMGQTLLPFVKETLDSVLLKDA